MRIGVVSDSHGSLDSLNTAVMAMGEVDILFHAGDHYEDALSLKKELMIPVYAVTGNCDWFSDGPREVTINIAGKKILLTHGHKYGVKGGRGRLVNYLENSDYDLVVFGHTHIAEIIPVSGRYLFNPGSIAKPRNGLIGTYGIIELKKDEIKPYIKEISE